MLIDDTDLWARLIRPLQRFAQADVPHCIAEGLCLGRKTALQKDNGKVRGIAAGTVVRRLPCRAVAMQFSSAFMTATAPFQSPLTSEGRY